MSKGIQIDAVSLVSIFVECILYGYFSILFAITLYVLFIKRTRHQPLNKPMVVVSIMMFLLATVHVGVDLRRVLDAFLHTNNPIANLSAVNTATYLVKSTAYCIQTLIGDGFVLYRLYLVWNGDKRIVLPLLVCFVASIGVGIGALQGFAQASPEAPVFITKLQQWIVSFFSLTLATNFSCTSLIAARIWWSHQRMTGSTMAVFGRSMIPAAIVVVESGAIYSACLIILLSLYLSGSFAQYIALDAVTQVIGIVFSLIIVRVGLGWSSETMVQTRTATAFVAGRGPSGNSYSRGNHAMVHISQITESDLTATELQHETDSEPGIEASKANSPIVGTIYSIKIYVNI
ncbi:hypothetical protein GYMLUDRAFT_253312 [Collybiopsis luxurians FD-317 M1]|uniref:Uncharacterized protein n=1 Tax=Collybiopsis luxurians FD-317 M1 TaxID=944289 RepID=A0A0D0B7L6_9AGAR|nr:hypothetical protein GYMLUDRAFT_253312 [Collybiopsis luxurians FD-317 M1]